MNYRVCPTRTVVYVGGCVCEVGYPLDCEVKERDLIVIEGHITVLSDFDELLSPMADVVRKA